MSRPPAAAQPDPGIPRPVPAPGYAVIPDGKGQCRDCGRILTLTWTGNGALIVHGPRAARCPGSGRLPVPWLQASGLPGWDDLSDLDKGAAVLQARYPGWPQLQPPYFDHPALLSLGPDAAHRHAVRVAAGHRRTPGHDLTRLLNLAAAAHRDRHPQRGPGGAAARNPQAACGLSFPAAPAPAGTGPPPAPPGRRTRAGGLPKIPREAARNQPGPSGK